MKKGTTMRLMTTFTPTKIKDPIETANPKHIVHNSDGTNCILS